MLSGKAFIDPIYSLRSGYRLDSGNRTVLEVIIDCYKGDSLVTNPTIISYYQTFGLVSGENDAIPHSRELSGHNMKSWQALLKYRISKS